MQIKDALLSLIHMVILLVFFSLGIFFFALSFSESSRYQIASLLLYEDKLLYLFGGSFLLLSLFLLIGFYQVHKKRYLFLQMERSPVEIDSNIIKEYVRAFWKETFPDKVQALDVAILPSDRVEIIAKISPMEKNEELYFLKTSEEEIGKILSNLAWYDQEFFLTLEKTT